VALVRIGNLVGQEGPTLLTTVSEVEPVRVNFPISETDYVKYPDRFKHFEMRDLAWAKRQFPKLDAAHATEEGDPGIELRLSDGSLYPHRGLIVTANRQIDQSTGTIQLQALVPNPDGALRPGQFGRVRVPRPNEGRAVLVVPERALASVQGTYSLAVVRPDDTIELRRVTLGPSTEGMRVVDSGVSEGDRIVVEGLSRAKNGTKVTPKAAPASSSSPAPSGAPSAAP
jgi:membrane fusion protein (multidrug efflux system)